MAPRLRASVSHWKCRKAVVISIAILLVLVASDIDHSQNRSHHRNGDSVHDHVVDALDPAPDLGDAVVAAVTDHTEPGTV